jgi:5-methyltetrahydrofolate--homocysteine methyltransferase
MEELLSRIAHCVEFGKVDKAATYPPDMKGLDGANELTRQALDAAIKADTILKQALVEGMDRVGKKFSEKKIFIPQMLMSAKAMNAAIEHLKPYFQSGEVQRKGKFIIATVQGDLHDIGKNLVKMSIEGAGWEVIDLGVDVKPEKILATIEENPTARIGLSALLTTTMQNMKNAVEAIKARYPTSTVLVGGAPVNEAFCKEIGADFYAPDPQGAVAFLNAI